jgi:hypothetical protein
VPRKPRRPGFSIPVACSDPSHHDEPGYADCGYHLVGTIRMARNADGPGRLTWSGPRAEPRGTVQTSGVTLSWPGIAPRLPVRNFRRDDGTAIWWFECMCGRSPKRSEPELTEIIGRLHVAGLPVVVDLVRLG